MQARILVIEDDIDIRRNLCRLLESEGYIVDLAENGQVALNFLGGSTEMPNLIILDLMMPVMDGFEFRRRQRENPSFADIPVAVMTADGHVDEKRIRTNANVALRKPADIEDILNAVKQFC